MQGWWPLGQSWLDIIVMEYFKAILTQRGKDKPSQSMGNFATDVGNDINAAHDRAANDQGMSEECNLLCKKTGGTT